jgi:hypothetical protein
MPTMREQKGSVFTDLGGKWVMPLKCPPLESVILKGSNFESRFIIADATTENATEAEQCLSRIRLVQHSGTQWSYILAYNSLQHSARSTQKSRHSQAKLSP